MNAGAFIFYVRTKLCPYKIMSVYAISNDVRLTQALSDICPSESRRVCPEPRRYNTPTVTVLSTWLRNNLKNPYPTISEKKELMKKTGLDRGQVFGSFII